MRGFETEDRRPAFPLVDSACHPLTLASRLAPFPYRGNVVAAAGVTHPQGKAAAKQNHIFSGLV